MAGLGILGAAGCLDLQYSCRIGNGPGSILGPQREGPACHILFPVKGRSHRPVRGFYRRRSQVGGGIVLCQGGPICQIGPLDLGCIPQGQGSLARIPGKNDSRICQRLTLGLQISHGGCIVVSCIRIGCTSQSAGHMLDLLVPGTDLGPAELGGCIFTAQADSIRRKYSRPGLRPGLAVGELGAGEPGEHRAQADGVLGFGGIRFVINHHADVGAFLHGGQKALDDSSVLDAPDYVAQFPFGSSPVVHQLGGAGIAYIRKAGDGVGGNMAGRIVRTVQTDISHRHAPGQDITADAKRSPSNGTACSIHSHSICPGAKGSSPVLSI